MSGEVFFFLMTEGVPPLWGVEKLLLLKNASMTMKMMDVVMGQLFKCFPRLTLGWGVGIQR